jgi:hypothetical protein
MSTFTINLQASYGDAPRASSEKITSWPRLAKIESAKRLGVPLQLNGWRAKREAVVVSQAKLAAIRKQFSINVSQSKNIHPEIRLTILNCICGD